MLYVPLIPVFVDEKEANGGLVRFPSTKKDPSEARPGPRDGGGPGRWRRGKLVTKVKPLKKGRKWYAAKVKKLKFYTPYEFRVRAKNGKPGPSDSRGWGQFSETRRYETDYLGVFVRFWHC